MNKNRRGLSRLLPFLRPQLKTLLLCLLMVLLVNAAELAMKAGVDMVITNGARPEDLYGIVAGEDIGTRFVAQPEILEL